MTQPVSTQDSWRVDHMEVMPATSTEWRIYDHDRDWSASFHYSGEMWTDEFDREVKNFCQYLQDNANDRMAKFFFEYFKACYVSCNGKAQPGKEFDLEILKQVIMPPSDRKSIIEALSQEQAQYREVLFNEWGFGNAFEKGKGVILLFYGIPGTGKTMLAEKIAEYLGKDHMILGNAELQSQIPGEMERNIKKAFAKAASDKIVIIFDECDTLLSHRSKVGTILAGEINCLLSEIERFEGTCILTTNRNAQLDPALERRIALKLEFKEPDKKMRKEIWQALIPDKCPVHKTVCFDMLSEHDLCGGHIKNAIFTAARRAVFAGKKTVGIKDFDHAIEVEIKGMTAFNGEQRFGPQTLLQDDMSVGQSVGRKRVLEHKVRRFVD